MEPVRVGMRISCNGIWRFSGFDEPLVGRFSPTVFHHPLMTLGVVEPSLSLVRVIVSWWSSVQKMVSQPSSIQKKIVNLLCSV